MLTQGRPQRLEQGFCCFLAWSTSWDYIMWFSGHNRVLVLLLMVLGSLFGTILCGGSLSIDCLVCKSFRPEDRLPLENAIGIRLSGPEKTRVVDWNPKSNAVQSYMGRQSDCVGTKNYLTHRPQSSSFLGLPYRILTMNPKKELLWGLWVRSWRSLQRRPREPTSDPECGSPKASKRCFLGS